MFCVRRYAILALTLPTLWLASGCGNTPAPALVTVGDAVLLSNVERLGVNLGPEAYYDDQQYLENPFLHGGFPKGRQSLIVRTKAGTSNAFADADFNPTDKDRRLARELTGGTYYVATGARQGEHGALLAHDLATGTFTVEKTGAPFEDDTYVWLRGDDESHALPEPEDPNVERGLGIGDFRLVEDEGVKVELADSDAQSRDQALNVLLPPETKEEVGGGVKHYLRATGDTAYRVHVRARSALSGARIGVRLMNLGVKSGDDGRIDFDAPLGATLTPQWRDLVFEAHNPHNTAINTSFGAIEVLGIGRNTTAETARIEIDAIRVEDLHLQSGQAFSKQVIDTLKEARPGTLRFYNVFDIAVPMEAFTAKDSASAPWSFLSLASGARTGTVTATLDECLALAKTVGARPWITVGNANTPEDWYNLLSYLGGPQDDPQGKRRADHGQADPWTSAFDRIYLEIGNEWWNPIFYPFHVNAPEKYGAICKAIIDRVKQHPNYDPARIKIVCGGWAINAHNWNGVVDAKSSGQDYLSVAPYLLNDLDIFKKPEDKYGALFASVDAYQQGGGASTRDALKANGKGTRLAVYELNTHLTGGKAPENVASEICMSSAAGVAVLDQAISMMANFGASPVNYFVLLQREFNGRGGLWGTLVREGDGTLVPRPVWQGLRLANQHFLDGDLVSTQVTGGGAWNQPENGSIPAMSGLPYIHAYTCITRDAQSQKRRAQVLLINRSVTLPIRATVALPFTPKEDAKTTVLVGNTIDSNNEDGEHVRLNSSGVKWPATGGVLLLPPASATVLQLDEA